MSTTFGKLNLQRNDLMATVIINGQEVLVKQYLPIEKKLELISTTVTQAVGSNAFVDPTHLEVYATLNIIAAYSDIVFTAKQRVDNITKTYDVLESSGAAATIIEAIPEAEYQFLYNCIDEGAKAYTAYTNSAAGILERASNSFSATEFDAEKLMATINDPEQLAIVKKMFELQQDDTTQKRARSDVLVSAT